MIYEFQIFYNLKIIINKIYIFWEKKQINQLKNFIHFYNFFL